MHHSMMHVVDPIFWTKKTPFLRQSGGIENEGESMPKVRKSHPPSLKAKVAVEAIKAHKTAACRSATNARGCSERAAQQGRIGSLRQSCKSCRPRSKSSSLHLLSCLAGSPRMDLFREQYFQSNPIPVDSLDASHQQSTNKRRLSSPTCRRVLSICPPSNRSQMS